VENRTAIPITRSGVCDPGSASARGGGAPADDLVSDSFAHTAALDGPVVAGEASQRVEQAAGAVHAHGGMLPNFAGGRRLPSPVEGV
jgi:hypothetical protein